LEQGPFLQAFRRKGRFTEFMARVPVHVIVQRAALIGAAICGLEVAAPGLPSSMPTPLN
jgi:glucokinase